MPVPPASSAPLPSIDSTVEIDARRARVQLQCPESAGPWAGSLLIEDLEVDPPPWLQVKLVDGEVTVARLPALASPYVGPGGRRGMLLSLSTSGSCYLERLVARFVELRQAAEASADEYGLDWQSMAELTWIAGELDRVITPVPGPVPLHHRRAVVIETTPPPR